MNKTHLLDTYYTKDKKRVNWRALKNIIPDDLEFLKDNTSFLAPGVSINERLYCYMNDITSHSVCECNNPITRFNNGYSKFCSLLYSNRSSDVKKKKESTTLKNYGVDNPSKSDDVKKKMRSTFIENYGVDNPSKVDDVKKKISDSVKNSLTKEVIDKREHTNLKKYGVVSYSQTDEWKTKLEQTSEKRFNVSHYSKTDEFKTRSKKTWIENYGVDNPSKSDDVKKKMRSTFIENYGVDNPSKSDDVKKKRKDTFIQRYGVENKAQLHLKESGAYDMLMSESKLVENVLKDGVQYLARKANISPSTIYMYLHKYGRDELINKNRSQYELKIEEFFRDNLVNFITNDRDIIQPKELDFVLPEYKIAIEVNGLYWHSEKSNSRDKNYHFDKWARCREAGYDLYSIYDDDINYKWDKVESKLRYLIKKSTTVIGARQVNIEQVNTADEFQFIDKYHIQGKTYKRSKALGAYYNDKLVAVINWVINQKCVEITRYCCDTSASYPGLFSKMMKAMISQEKYVGDIVSFSNNDHSNGNLYKQAGFKIDKILGPAYWYTYDYSNRENRQKYMKAKIAKKFGIDMTDKTEWEAMQELGYDRVWDSGKIKWKKTV